MDLQWWIQGGDDWGDRPYKTCESTFVHNDFVQAGKHHSRCTVVWPPTVLSEQCCKEYFISPTVA